MSDLMETAFVYHPWVFIHIISLGDQYIHLCDPKRQIVSQLFFVYPFAGIGECKFICQVAGLYHSFLYLWDNLLSNRYIKAALDVEVNFLFQLF